MRDALVLLETAARKLAAGDAMNAPRQRVHAGGAMLQVLPAALDGRTGHKAYTVGPRGARFWMTLYAHSGEMLAMIEANRLGQIRTGAASGLATRFLAHDTARSLGVLGTGFQARTQIEAVCLVRPIATVRVWGRDRERLERFCRELNASGIAVEAARSAQDAVANVDIVITMTSSVTPVLQGSWLQAGTHVNAAGSNRANAHELDAEAVRRAAIVVVEDVAQAKLESGNLMNAQADGAFEWNAAVTLAEIVAGTAATRTSDAQITLFESLGVGIWDIAVASNVYDTCRNSGRGTELPFAG